MPMTLTDAMRAIQSAGYTLEGNGKRKTKTIKFVSPRRRRTLYLRRDQGFPRVADVNIHPEILTTTIATISGVPPGGRSGLRSGDSMKDFPEWPGAPRENNYYGRAFRCASLDALTALCREYDSVL